MQQRIEIKLTLLDNGAITSHIAIYEGDRRLSDNVASISRDMDFERISAATNNALRRVLNDLTHVRKQQQKQKGNQ